MHSTVTLTMVDGVKAVVPDSLDLMTPYVLREQQDWFEDEIKFLRRLLQPGQSAVDIGANYGLYTLSIAKTVGPAGHVWAIEPASAVAGLLRESITANGFEHITLEQSALSDTTGTARLSLRSPSELNALVHDDTSTQPTEAVRVITLDDYAKNSGWRDIDFIKIDAEGEELNILKGGTDFFSGIRLWSSMRSRTESMFIRIWCKCSRN
jgi:FkbM family methyltransferase